MLKGRVYFKEKVAKAYHELFGLEDLFKYSEVVDKLYSSSIMIRASKDNILLYIAIGSRLPYKM